MSFRSAVRISGSTVATALFVAALIAPVGARASIYTYDFTSGPLACDPSSLACDNEVPMPLEPFAGGAGTTLDPLEARLVVDEAELPGGTLGNAMASWYSEFTDGEPGNFLDAPPDWLVSFRTNYGDPDEADLAVSVEFKTDADRRIVEFSAFRWTLGGVPHEYMLFIGGRVALASVQYGCEDPDECFSYLGSLAPVVSAALMPLPRALVPLTPALVPLPPALVPFLTGLSLIGGCFLLRDRRRARR